MALRPMPDTKGKTTSQPPPPPRRAPTGQAASSKPPPSPSQMQRVKTASKIATRPEPPKPPLRTHAPVQATARTLLEEQLEEQAVELGESQLIDVNDLEREPSHIGHIGGPVPGPQSNMFSSLPSVVAELTASPEDIKASQPNPVGNARPKSTPKPPRPSPKPSRPPAPSASASPLSAERIAQTTNGEVVIPPAPPVPHGIGNTLPQGVAPVQRRSVTPQGVPVQRISTLPPPPSPPQGRGDTPMPNTRPSSGGPPPLPQQGQRRASMSSVPVQVQSMLPAPASQYVLTPEDLGNEEDFCRQAKVHLARLERPESMPHDELCFAVVILGNLNGRIKSTEIRKSIRQRLGKPLATEMARRMNGGKPFIDPQEAETLIKEKKEALPDARRPTQRKKTAKKKKQEPAIVARFAQPSRPLQRSGGSRNLIAAIIMIGIGIGGTLFCQSEAGQDLAQRMFVPAAPQR